MAELESSNIAYATCGRFGAPAGSPDSLARSATAFDRAHEHYDAGEYRKAAEAFGRAADVLREGPGADEDVVTRNRRVAYANMVLALLSIDAVDEARRRLSAAARVDQPLAPDLTTVEGALPSPPRCDLRAPDRPG